MGVRIELGLGLGLGLGWELDAELPRVEQPAMFVRRQNGGKIVDGPDRHSADELALILESASGSQPARPSPPPHPKLPETSLPCACLTRC